MNKLPVLLHVGTWRDGRTARVDTDTSAEGISEALATGLATDGEDECLRILLGSYFPIN